MLLSRSDREFVSLEEDLELLDAYLDVVNSPRHVTTVTRDLPRIEFAANAAVPAMLFPTLGAAMSGDVELLRVELREERLAVALRSGQRPVHITTLDECAARLHDLYDGRAHFAVERDDVGRTIVELAFPARTVADENADTIAPDYDLATA